MSRWLLGVWAITIVAATFGLYIVKYEVQSLRSENAQLMADLESEREALHVIAAEWAYLNRPTRLEKLSRKHLAADELTAQQVADVEALPYDVAAGDAGASSVHAVSYTVGGDE